MTDVARAETVLSELTVKRDAHVLRGTSLSEERRKISFAAITGDQGARKQLDKLNLEYALHQGEHENLNAAIEEAAKRLDVARGEEARKADRKKALEFRTTLLPQLLEHGKKIDAALATIASEANAFDETLRQIHASGCAFPNTQQVHVNGAMVIYSALMQTPWRREFRHLAPHERRTFEDLFAGQAVGDGVHVRSGWRQPIERFISQLLGEAETEAA